MSAFALILLAILSLLLLAGAATDLHSRIIPNRLNIAIALLAPLWWLAMGWSPTGMMIQIGSALAVLVLFALAFAAGMMGGGDVKLLAAVALWLPGLQMMRMLVWMAIAGGVLTVGMIALHRARRRPGQPEIPYGVAIVGSTLAIITNAILTIPTA